MFSKENGGSLRKSPLHSQEASGHLSRKFRVILIVQSEKPSEEPQALDTHKHTQRRTEAAVFCVTQDVNGDMT